MDCVSKWGVFFIGFVFGYLLYYSVRHTKEFSIDLLASAFGAIGGAAVVEFFSETKGWIGPYGLGIGAGFLLYLILSLILILSGKFQQASENKVMLLSQTLLGSPREEKKDG